MQNTSQNLCEAVENGNSDIIEQLLGQGANADAVSSFGQPVIVRAASRGDQSTVEALLKYGADVNRGSNIIGETALYRTVEINEISITKVLLSAGADANIKTSLGESPLMIVEDPEIARMLLDYGADLNIKDPDGETPLFKVIKKKDFDTAHLLLTSGARLDADSNGTTPLMIAASYKTPSIIRLLLGSDVDVNASNHSGKSALHFGAGVSKYEEDVSHTDAIETLRLLLEHGAHVNHTDSYGWTALIRAAGGENSEISVGQVRALLEYGAKVNVLTSDLYTAVSWAEERGNPEVIDVLKGDYDDNRGDMKNSALEHILLAQSHFLDGNNHEAIAEYEKSISSDPDNALPYCRLGALYKIIGQESMSLDMYIKSIELDPNRSEGHYGLGQYYLSVLGNYPQAVHELQIAEKFAPRSPDVLFILGLALFSDGARDESLAKLKASVELGLNPQSAELAHRIMDEIGKESTDFPEWLLTNFIQTEQPIEEPSPTNLNEQKDAELLYGKAARLHIQQSMSNSVSEYKNVIDLYSKAIELDPSKERFFNSRGNAYLDLDNYRKALSDYDTAIRLGCETPAIYFLRGTCFEELGNIKKAHAVYTKGIETHPLDPDCYFALGRLFLYSALVLHPLGNLDRAALNMGKALEIDTQSVSHKQYFECIQDVKNLQIGRSITQKRRTQLRKSIQELLKTKKPDTKTAGCVYSDGRYYHKSICSDLKLESLIIGEGWAESIFEPCPKCIGSRRPHTLSPRGSETGKRDIVISKEIKNKGLARYTKNIDQFIREHNGDWTSEDWTDLYESCQSDSYSFIDEDELWNLLEDRKTEYFKKRKGKKTHKKPGPSKSTSTAQNQREDEKTAHYRRRHERKRNAKEKGIKSAAKQSNHNRNPSNDIVGSRSDDRRTDSEDIFYVGEGSGVFHRKECDYFNPQNTRFRIHRRVTENYRACRHCLPGFSQTDPKQKDECFVATATFQGQDQDVVIALRAYRDEILYKTGVGRFLIHLYNLIGPTIARLILQLPMLRSITAPCLRFTSNYLARST